MNKKELIEALQEFPDDSEIYLPIESTEFKFSLATSVYSQTIEVCGDKEKVIIIDWE